MPIKVRVYDRQTGSSDERYAVVAKEMVDSDPERFSLTADDKPAKTQGEVGAEGTEPVAEKSAKPKGGGRKRAAE